MSITISNYAIQISAVSRGVTNVFRSVANQASSLGDTVQSALTFGVGNFLDISTLADTIGNVASTLSGFDQIDPLTELARTSDRLQVLPEELQVLQRAAQSTGVDVDALGDALTEFAKRASEAQADGGAIADTFGRLGIDPGQFRLQGPVEQLQQLEAALDGIESNSDRLFILDELASDSAVALNGLFGSGAIEDARAFFDEVGGGLDRFELAQVENANNALGELRSTFELLTQRVLVGLSPAIEAAAALAQDFVANFQLDPARITDVIVNAVAATENWLGPLASVQDIIGGIGTAWQFMFDIFRRVQQGILIGLSFLTEGISRLIQVAASASDALGFEGVAESLRNQAGFVDSFTDSFSAQADSIGDAIAGIEPEIQEGGLADRIRDTIENARIRADAAIEATTTNGNLNVGGLPAAASSLSEAAQSLRQAALPAALQRNSADAVNAINQSFRTDDLESLNQQQNRTLKSIDNRIAEQNRTSNSTNNQRVNVNVTLTC